MKRKYFLHFFVLFFGISLFSCSIEPSYNRYVPEAHFLFSTDATANKIFRETVEDIQVGSQFWIRVEVQIKCGILSSIVHSSNARKIPVSVIIPNTEILEISLMGASTAISPIEDKIKGTISYPFYAYASTNPKKVYVVFRCKALKPGTQKISIEYGNLVNKDHNQFHIITYVDKQD